MFAEVLRNSCILTGGSLITMLPIYTLFSQFLFLAEGDGYKLLGAGICSFGMIGASLGQGLVGYGACLAIGRNPEVAPKVTSTLIITAGFAESGAIYALVISILLIFVA
ncbi:F0F1 ATP synthase subunit C [Spiroplasma turonicum]|uniref:ATP synthase subunit c n=2 Tax=Spiroplasma turonicum TaxID=216946 RepID=A0A0K1P5U5_9MOLU|nr:F0F1 ATP synthase subunit C [Spiroplasma turonicum]AKU79292.1 F0F1 ATP synthase subunit C [Spiroplasma turonicum]ALX70315.1 F0F1 ATP synthase subunit C [Spiroplasma turonicum]